MNGGSIKKQEMLSTNRFTFIVFGAVVGAGLLSLPNGVVKEAYQNGWISTLIGSCYPMFVFAAANFIAKKTPDESIITLNKRYFGKYIGNVMNFALFSYCIAFTVMIASFYSNIIRVYALGFLTPLKVVIIYFVVVVYANYKGMRAIGVISEITFYIVIGLVLSAIPALKIGKLSNIRPIADVSIKSLLKGGMQSIFAYTGGEVIFTLYPLMKDRSKLAASSIFNFITITVIYVWVVFITTYYFGPDIVVKFYWSFLEVTDAVTITVINNFRYIFILLWSLVAFRSSSIYLFTGICVAKNYLDEKKVNILLLLLYPILTYLTLKLGNEATRQKLTSLITLICLIFNLVYITIMVFLVFIKEREKK